MEDKEKYQDKYYGISSRQPEMIQQENSKDIESQKRLRRILCHKKFRIYPSSLGCVRWRSTAEFYILCPVSNRF